MSSSYSSRRSWAAQQEYNWSRQRQAHELGRDLLNFTQASLSILLLFFFHIYEINPSKWKKNSGLHCLSDDLVAHCDA